MIYTEPTLESIDHQVLKMIDRQRSRLGTFTQHNPKRWMGSIRRRTFARAIQGSNSIEGYNASMDQVIAAIEGEPPIDERNEITMAIEGYRNAMTYVMQAARDPYFDFSKQFLKSLHFMMIGFDMTKNPGQWRPGSIFVVNSKSGDVVYEAPDQEQVDPLVCELVEYVRGKTRQHLYVKAAMAHLNLTMIHPFSDGNGRMARALQTLIIGLDGLLHPVFSSIEEWLGDNTEEYYAVLGETGEGRWQPQRSAQKWMRFCLKAHYQQGSKLLRRMGEYERLYAGIIELIKHHALHERMALPMFDAALGLSLTNARYQGDAQVTFHIASRDLKKLSELGLLDAQGETRARRYSAGPELRALRKKYRTQKPLVDPYELASSSGDLQGELPGL